MRKTITGTGGMLLLQTLKDAGVEYIFTNPGSAETGIFAALAEDGDTKLVMGKHEGLVAAMADGYHRISGKVGSGRRYRRPAHAGPRAGAERDGGCRPLVGGAFVPDLVRRLTTLDRQEHRCETPHYSNQHEWGVPQ